MWRLLRLTAYFFRARFRCFSFPPFWPNFGEGEVVFFGAFALRGEPTFRTREGIAHSDKCPYEES